MTISCSMRCSRCRLGLALFRLEHSPLRNTLPISRTRRRGGRKEWPADDGSLDGLPEVVALFAAGAQVAADAAELFRALQGAKAAGDFLPDFDHADVLLGLVVGEGHTDIPQEGQHGIRKIFQPIQQIGRLALGTP